MSCGKAIIGANIGGISELVLDNETGLYFQSGSSEDLAGKILGLIQYQDKLNEFSDNSHKIAKANFNATSYYHKLITVYEDAVLSQK